MSDTAQIREHAGFTIYIDVKTGRFGIDHPDAAMAEPFEHVRFDSLNEAIARIDRHVASIQRALREPPPEFDLLDSTGQLRRVKGINRMTSRLNGVGEQEWVYPNHPKLVPLIRELFDLETKLRAARIKIADYRIRTSRNVGRTHEHELPRAHDLFVKEVNERTLRAERKFGKPEAGGK